MRALIVWEPVLDTDWGEPGSSLTSTVSDARAVHFWDHDRRLSAAMGGQEALARLARERLVGFRMKDVIWDAAFVYPPGAKWGAEGDFLAAPVVKFKGELETALAGGRHVKMGRRTIEQALTVFTPDATGPPLHW